MKHARDVDMPILSGCNSYDDCMRAIRQGVRLLKFYPSFKVPPDTLKDIVSRIVTSHVDKDDDDNHHHHDDVRIFVAGSVKLSDLKPYLDAGYHA